MKNKIAIIGNNAPAVIRLTLLKESQGIIVVDSKQEIASQTSCFAKEPFFIRAYNNGGNLTLPPTRAERRKLKRKSK